jgi:hypothetical protein
LQREQLPFPEQKQEAPMPQSAHARAAEFHLLAAHAHESAATHHEKGDHLSGHELSRQAHEHAAQAWQWSQTAAQKSAAAKGIPETGSLPFGQSAPHPDNDQHAVFNPTLTSAAASEAAGLPAPAPAKKAGKPVKAAPAAKKAGPAAKSAKTSKSAPKTAKKKPAKSKKK